MHVVCEKKFHDLAAIAFLENYDIIGVTESWVNTEKSDFLAEYNIQGYSLFSCERSERTGGGVLLYVKPHLHPQVITKPQISNIDVKYVQNPLRIGKTYSRSCLSTTGPKFKFLYLYFE